MTDFLNDEECVTHYICDCLNKRMIKLEAENRRLKEKLKHEQEANHQAWDRIRELELENAELLKNKEEVNKMIGNWFCTRAKASVTKNEDIK